MQPQNPYFIAAAASFRALKGDWDDAHRHVVELRSRTPGQTDTWRLWEMNKGPGDQPLANRFGEGLRLAHEAAPEQRRADRAQ